MILTGKWLTVYVLAILADVFIVWWVSVMHEIALTMGWL